VVGECLIAAAVSLTAGCCKRLGCPSAVPQSWLGLLAAFDVATTSRSDLGLAIAVVA